MASTLLDSLFRKTLKDYYWLYLGLFNSAQAFSRIFGPIWTGYVYDYYRQYLFLVAAFIELAAVAATALVIPGLRRVVAQREIEEKEETEKEPLLA